MQGLFSSVSEKGQTVTQIIGFASGHKKTWKHVVVDSIMQSEFTRFDLADGRRVYINTPNVNWFEVISEKD